MAGSAALVTISISNLTFCYDCPVMTLDILREILPHLTQYKTFWKLLNAQLMSSKVAICTPLSLHSLHHMILPRTITDFLESPGLEETTKGHRCATRTWTTEKKNKDLSGDNRV